MSKAFIIEDDRALAMIFSEALKGSGFSTEVFYDGETAIEGLKAEKPRLILLDLHLPGKSGMDVMAFIKGYFPVKPPKVIVSTADARMAEELDQDADLVLIKPISFFQLKSLAERFI